MGQGSASSKPSHRRFVINEMGARIRMLKNRIGNGTKTHGDAALNPLTGQIIMTAENMHHVKIGFSCRYPHLFPHILT